MAKRQEEPPSGAPAWMATFSDLMNLLLCFFVLLFSMSSVDADKYEIVVNSLTAAFSIMPAGGSSVTDGILVGSGISQLPEFSQYFGDSLSKGEGDSEGKTDTGDEANKNTSSDSEQQQSDTSSESTATAEKQIQAVALSESEEMAANIEKKISDFGIQDQVQVDFNGQYVRMTLNGSLLFDSGKAEVKPEGTPIIQKIAVILNQYQDRLIEVEGHCDNVPIASSKYENNDVLSMYRALYVADLIRQNSSVNPSHIFSSGRGSYNPIADNGTAEGRARNRRVEIKVYNSYNSANLE